MKNPKMAKQLESKHCRGIISAHFEPGVDRTIPHSKIFIGFLDELGILRHTFFGDFLDIKMPRPIHHNE